MAKTPEQKKDIIIKKTISQRIEDAKSFLISTEKELKSLRRKKREIPDPEMIGGIQHQIGYMTSLKYELEQILELMNMSYEQILEMIEKNKKIEVHNKKVMQEILNLGKLGVKTKNKKYKK